MLRGAGVLLHVVSLPGGCYVGDVGPEAYRFVDSLADTEQTYWQILPIYHTLPEYENSPYNAVSSYAGDPVLTSLDKLVEDKLLDATPQCEPTDRVNYIKAWEIKSRALAKAFKKGKRLADYKTFKDTTSWLEDYAAYMALRERYGPWPNWPKEVNISQQRVEFFKFVQFVFWRQWADLKHYANSRGVFIIGDLPIYLNLDSVEVWRHREYFKIADGRPAYMAGVPPDYFSSTGQLWGNPVFNWEAIERDQYRWWVERLRHLLSAVDYVRLDHFRGYVAYWEVPWGEKTAVRGRWVPGPGERLFKKVQLDRLVAEDLGYITEDVVTLRDMLGIPGMKVLQFAWDGNPANPHKPHNHVKNSVVYTGTHDNNTAVGWFAKEASPKAKREFLTYSSCRDEINWCFIKLAYMSVADVAIIPMQDILGLGEEARMNKPGAVGGNWRWRLVDHPPAGVWRKVKKLTRLYGR